MTFFTLGNEFINTSSIQLIKSHAYNSQGEREGRKSNLCGGEDGDIVKKISVHQLKFLWELDNEWSLVVGYEGNS